jgi:hypothetical protein
MVTRERFDVAPTGYVVITWLLLQIQASRNTIREHRTPGAA